MELIDRQGTGNQAGPQQRHVSDGQLPHGRVIVGENLQLGVQVQVKEDKASKSSSRMAAGHALEGIINLIRITGANLPGEVDAVVPDPVQSVVAKTLELGDIRLADVEEMGTQTADQPLDEDLEDGGGDQAVEEANDAVVEVPK